MPTLLDAALVYAESDWKVFPCSPANKQPLTTNGFYDASSDPEQLCAWWQQHPDALIGCRIPADCVVLDIDPRHGGDATWRALCDHYGEPDIGLQHFSGRGDGGTHIWFLRPEGKLTVKSLNQFARENGTGHATGKRNWTSGIDILHNTQRYTILPPSPHPDTGKPYRWRASGHPGPMPGWLAHYLTTAPEPAEATPQRPNLRLADADSIADWFSASLSWADILGPAGWVLVAGDGDGDGSKWRHPNASAESSASVRHGCLFVYTPNTDLEQTEEGSPNGHTRFRAWAALEHGGDLRRAARTAREMRDGPDIDLPTSRPTTAKPGGNTTVAPAAAPVGTNLPAGFWEARPVLRHIRQAAHARARSADAVLGCVLARMSAMIHPSYRLPPIAGAPSALSVYTALVGPSGTGKSSAKSVACELLPCTNERIGDDLPIGSGEGLLEAYMGFVDDEGPDGKKRKTKRQIRDGVFAFLDEGQALAELGSRKGSTLLPILRQMWTGGSAGTTNASAETNRILKAGTYALGLVIGFQPEMAAGLLDDHVGGTPQRFDWVSATDPSIPDIAPDWPGPIDWRHPPIYSGEHGMLAVAGTIVSTIRREALAVSRHEKVLDGLDSHANLSTLKVAAVLAMLDGRREVTEEDWELASVYRSHSNLARRILLEIIAIAERKKEEASTARHLRREQALAEDSTKHAIEKMARSIARHVGRLACDGGCTKRCVTLAVASRDRKLATVDDAVEHAIGMKWITRTGEGFAPAVEKVA